MASTSRLPVLPEPAAGCSRGNSALESGESERQDAILRVCSYHRRDFDLVLVRSPPHEMQPVQDSIQEAFEARPSLAGLGMLDRLPIELMFMVLRYLDVLSYFRFRQVSHQARALSTSLREYKLVAKYGMEGLRGLLRARVAHSFTVTDLYRPLITSDCACGAFGGFLFLPTATRCCFACIATRPGFRLHSAATFSRLMKFSKMKISKTKLSKTLIPMFSTVPGTYCMADVPVRRPKDLVAHTQAIAALKQYDAFSESRTLALGMRNDQESYRFMASTAFPWCELGTGRVERGVSCKGCQIRDETQSESFRDRNQVFSKAGFLIHFSQCAEAQALWVESRDGTRSPAEPEFTRRCGYFNEFGPEGLPR